MSIQAAQGLKKLNDRHRRAAHLLVQGMTFAEISREVGCHPDHWSRLVKYSELFQRYLTNCRKVAESIYMTSTERLSSGAIERKLDKLALRQRRRQERQERCRRGKSAAFPDQMTASPPRTRMPETVPPGPQKGNSETGIAQGRERDWSVEAIEAELAAERHQQPTVRPSPPPLGQRPTGGLYANAQGLSGRRRW